MEGNWYKVTVRPGFVAVLDIPAGTEPVFRAQGYELEMVEVMTRDEFLTLFNNATSFYHLMGRLDEKGKDVE